MPRNFRRPTAFTALLAAVLAAATGCGGGTPVDGTSGSIGLALNPTSATIMQGGSTQVTGTLTRTNFTGGVTITIDNVPTGVTGSATLADDIATVTIAANGSAPTGSYTLAVHAKGAGVADAAANFTLGVVAATPASYTLALGSPALSVAQGQSGNSTLQLVRTNFTGGVVFSADSLPLGVTASFDATPVTTNSANVLIAVGANVVPGTYTVRIHGTAAGLTDVVSPLTLTVVATGNFTIAASSASVTLTPPGSATTTISATRTGGFTGSISYSATSNTAGLTAALAPTAIADQRLLTVAATAAVAPGTYPVAISATSTGVTTQQLTINVTVTAPGTFTIAAGNASITLTPPGSATTTITATRTGGFTGSISYSATSNTSGLTATVAPTAIADQSMLTVAATAAVAPGTYPIAVSAAATGVTTQQLTISVTVTAPAGFTIATGATALSVRQGAATTSWIKAARTFGFAGVIAYQVTGTPTGLTVAIAPTSVADSSTITVTAAADVPIGPYTLVLNATSGALTATPINLVITVTTSALSGIVQLGAGDTHMCGVDAAGVGYCWGNNNQGQLGDPTFAGPTSAVPRVVLASGHVWAEIRGGRESSCTRTTDGAAYCWGEGIDGGVGNGIAASVRTPTAVTSSGQNYAQVSPGAFFACGRTIANIVWCWGGNFDGQIGDGTFTQRNSPVLVQTGGLSFVDIVASPNSYFTCGRISSGAAYCWGYNGNGELADNTTVNRTSPVAVMGGNTFSSLVAGSDNACGRITSGSWMCWGANAYGELGDGSQTERHTPVPLLSGGNTFVQLTMGTFHTCGRTAAGAVFCWGRNSSGQLGNGGTQASNAPVAVSGGHVFTDIRAGDNFTCGLSDGGTVFCWGDNARSQLGSSTVGSSNVPLQVHLF